LGIKADLHVHTRFSKDSLSDVKEVLDAGIKSGMGAIAITDHDEIQGALEAARIAKHRKLPIQVIVGEEVSTDKGDLLVYFLKERIAPGKLEDALAEARRQKAVCSSAHPYDFARHGIALERLPGKLLAQIGCVEAFNARVILPEQNARAMKFALAHGKPILAGSDAHHPSEIGGAYVEFDGTTPLYAASLLNAPRKIGGKAASPMVRIHTRYAVLRKKLHGIFPLRM
jgi:predicted metal-dependent phosphoesterase TrpH